MGMRNPLKNRVLALVLVLFALLLVLSVSPWWRDIMGGVEPQPPNVSAIYLGTKAPGGHWQFIISDRLLSDCAVGYVYNYTPNGVLTVYELDGGTLAALGFKNTTVKCRGLLTYGYLAVNFTQRPDVLSVDLWVSKSSTNGRDVYFVEIGNWRFVNGSYIGYTAPPMSNNYMLLNVSAVEEMVNRTGIHYVNRR
ncbi:hypothetical protein [Thermococcus sp.]|uniref:hypothetical protein n=1 Tax=Thermococcus sp. TaxID=35749 RepID=UPI00261024F2|nr:hypothetical protein [Thermococcus sp.]